MCGIRRREGAEGGGGGGACACGVMSRAVHEKGREERRLWETRQGQAGRVPRLGESGEGAAGARDAACRSTRTLIHASPGAVRRVAGW